MTTSECWQPAAANDDGILWYLMMATKFMTSGGMYREGIMPLPYNRRMLIDRYERGGDVPEAWLASVEAVNKVVLDR